MYASMPTRDVKNNVWLESSECKVVHTVRNVFKRPVAGLLVGNTATTSKRSPATVCRLYSLLMPKAERYQGRAAQQCQAAMLSAQNCVSHQRCMTGLHAGMQTIVAAAPLINPPLPGRPAAPTRGRG